MSQWKVMGQYLYKVTVTPSWQHIKTWSLSYMEEETVCVTNTTPPHTAAVSFPLKWLDAFLWSWKNIFQLFFCFFRCLDFSKQEQHWLFFFFLTLEAECELTPALIHNSHLHSLTCHTSLTSATIMNLTTMFYKTAAALKWSVYALNPLWIEIYN